MTDFNLLIIIVAFVIAVIAIYILYSIILFQGSSDKGGELQLSTKNILEQVEVLFEKKEYALVELLATKYLDRVPNHLEVRIYLAKAYYEDKKYNHAIKQCSIILRGKNANNIDTRQVLGDCYIKKHQPGKAIKEYEFLFDHKKGDKTITKTLAELYRQTDQIYSAIAVYEALSELMSSDEDIAYVQSILAELNEKAHDYPAAFEAYKTRLGIYPNDVETNRKLTELYIKIKNYPVAIETLHYMLSFVTEPKTLLWIHETLVSLYVETEDYEKAIEHSEKLLEIQGSDKFKIRNDIANFNIKLGHAAEGITILEDLAMMSQDGFDVTLELAEAYIKQREFNKALERYKILLDKANQQEAKTLNLLMCELYIKWAIDYTSMNKIEESFDMLKNAAQYNTINPEIYYNGAVNYFEQKNYTNAVESVNQAIEYDKLNEHRSKYLLLLSKAHHQLGNFFEEKKALTDLLKFDEKNPQGLYHVGLLYASQHDVKNAEEAFRKALQYEPDLLEAKYNLALLYESNNRDKAKELYMEVLEQDPTFEEAKRALNDLSTSDFI